MGNYYLISYLGLVIKIATTQSFITWITIKETALHFDLI